MGAVYAARDRVTGRRVALKRLTGGDPDFARRFMREARILAEIHHPAVVRYVAHGLIDDEDPYLAMEWLEGEDLAARLASRPLTLHETMILTERVAGALAAVHARGVVHRDVKPANLFLVGGKVEDARLIDFGIAFLDAAGATQVTVHGMGIGTPGYMAPEQARGDRAVTAAADVFSLGAVLFECLTGRPAFEGEHLMAVLARVLLEPAPPIGELATGVPEGLEDLVSRMLAKDPECRPPDGAALIEEIAAMGPMSARAPVRRGRAQDRPAALTGGEQRLVSVLLVGLPAGASDRPPARPLDGSTLASLDVLPGDATLRALAIEHGGRFDCLADGTRMLTLVSAGAATDQAVRAARCALRARVTVPGPLMALSTGQGRIGGRGSLGGVIDRAAQLLRADAGAHDAVRVDELTAGLLDARFEIDRPAGASPHLLRGELRAGAPRRTLLGRPTLCVGRERELLLLRTTFEAAVSEPAAAAVLVTAGAGVGKSHLVNELLRQVQAPEVWIARGDPMGAGAPFGLAGQMIRRAARLVDGEPIEDRRRKLAARVARHVPAGERDRVTEFLGELTGTPFPDEGRVQLRAARQDAQRMGDQTRRAFVDLLDAESDAGPVVLVLEDLHWGDRPTVEILDTALRLLRDRPILVLALARPEVHEIFPDLWVERGVTEVHLGELSRRACERLARDMLGPAADEATVATVVDRSAGNAFFLEELIRAAAEGRTDVPGTVLAMVQSRLSDLDPEARRVLRAGSVLGKVFWAGAVSALLGGPLEATLEAQLEQLVADEWIAERPEPRFQGEREYVFRHAIVREAAYGMLTEDDRALGHRLAASWLGSAGERDAAVLATHFELGGAREEAADHYRKAAAQALEAHDLAGAVDRVDRAIACGAGGEARGALFHLRSEAHDLRGEIADAKRWAIAAMSALPEGSEAWFAAGGQAAAACRKLGHSEELTSVTEALREAFTAGALTAKKVVAVARATVSLYHDGAYEPAGALRSAIEAEADLFIDDPAVNAYVAQLRSWHAMVIGDAGGELTYTAETVHFFEQAGDVRAACWHRANLGYVSISLGAYEITVAPLREALAFAERLGLGYVAALARNNLGLALARTGALVEARLLEEEAVRAAEAQGNPRLSGGSRMYLAQIHHLAGDLAAAEAEARRAVATLAQSRPLLPAALATLADTLLAQGRAGEALPPASDAAVRLADMGYAEEGAALVGIVHAEALAAAGDVSAARAALTAARARLLVRADRIQDRALRDSFLRCVPEHARTLARAEAWGIR